jgi:hypothetical protein
MLSRAARILGSLVTGMLLTSCSATDITDYQPLVGAETLAVQLQTTTGIPVSGLPRLAISATAAETFATQPTHEIGRKSVLVGAVYVVD